MLMFLGVLLTGGAMSTMGNAIGVGISNAMLRNKVKKGIEKYCDQHPGENYAWQVDGKVVASDFGFGHSFAID